MHRAVTCIAGVFCIFGVGCKDASVDDDSADPVLGGVPMSGGGQGAGGGVEKIPEGTGAGDARSGGTDARGAQNQNADAAGTADVGPQLCGPTGGGPHWVEEGGTVTAILKCATGRVALGDAFIFGTLPRGATYDVATATLTWKTSLDQAGVHLLPITVRPWNETGEIKIGVV